MAKIDLKSAYRHVPIHPSNYKATGLKWTFTNANTFTYFYDTKLPFGAKQTPEIFHRITQSIRQMMQQRGLFVVAYLDDFFYSCQHRISMLDSLLGAYNLSWMLRTDNKLEQSCITLSVTHLPWNRN